MKYISKLTIKQRVVLDYISEYINKNKKSPLIKEIQAHLKSKSVRSVTQYLDVLVKKGYIIRTNNSRGIQLVNRYKNIENETIDVPVYGSASCGDPNFFADDNIEDYIAVSKKLLKNDQNNYFVLKAVGDSMNKADINDSSLVLVEKTNELSNGDKIVALIHGLATIKRFFKGENALLLKPDSTNESHKPIIVDTDYNIIGKVISVLPNFNNAELKYVEEPDGIIAMN